MSLTLAAIAERCAARFPAPAVPVPAPGEEAAPAPLPPVQLMDYAKRGFHLNLSVEPGQVVEAARLLDEEGFAIDTITGVDWIKVSQFEIVYDYFHPLQTWRVAVRTRVGRDNPEVPTISAVFPGANWHERETHDFFGIRFLGHPNLNPLLLPEDADYHPLRKDFVA